MNFNFEQLFKQGPVVIVLWRNNKDWPIDFVSDNVFHLIAYKKEEILSGSFNYSKILYPEDKKNIYDELNQFASESRDFYVHKPYRLISKTNEIKWVLDYTIVIKNEKNEITHYLGYLIDYTDKYLSNKKIIEQNIKLKDSEERLKLALYGAQAGLWDWNIITGDLIFDQRWAQILGYEQNELENHVNTWKKLLHKDDLIRINEVLNRHLKGKTEFYTCTYRMKTKRGEWKWILDNGKVIEFDNTGKPVRAIGTHIDITEDKEKELALELSQHNAEHSHLRFKTLFNAISDSIFVHSADSILDSPFIEVNDAACLKYGYSREEFLKLSVKNLTVEKSFQKIKEQANNIDSNKEKTFECQQFTKSGKIIDVKVNISKFNFDNEKYYISVVHDITKEKESALNLKRINNELNIAKNKAEESDRLKSAFLANMSHEIRTPLNAIVGFSGFLKEQNKTKEQINKYANIIESSGKHLLTLINDIIDLSKIDAGQMDVYYSSVNIHELLDEMFQMFNGQILNSGKNIELRINKTLWELSLWIDEMRMRQIFINLLSNAYKFTTKGFIEFGYTIENEIITFYVQDSGIGIPIDKQELIFERFTQAADNTEKVFGGTGLGLPIVKASVELLGAELKLESTESIGTIISFSLPITKSKDSENNNSNENQMISFENELVLVAEDEDLNFEFLKHILNKNNLSVLRANNGKETLDLLINNKAIKLVLLDIKMPEINGWDLVPMIKKQRPDIKIIAQTAYGLESEIRKGFEIGFDDYITKPIEKNKLLQVIHTMLY